jgi:hypothetical protein
VAKALRFFFAPLRENPISRKGAKAQRKTQKIERLIIVLKQALNINASGAKI